MSPVNLSEVLARAYASDGQTGMARAEAGVASFSVKVIRNDADIARLAADAFARFRGRPARRNLGDCFAYALAKSRDAPLLFNGGDFAKTDIAAV